MNRTNDPLDNRNGEVIPIELKMKLYTSQNENNVPQQIESKNRTKIIRDVLGDCADIGMSAMLTKSSRNPVWRSTARENVKTNESLCGKRNENDDKRRK